MDETSVEENLSKISRLLALLQERGEKRWERLLSVQLVWVYVRLADVLEASDQAAYQLEKLARKAEISNAG